MHSSRKEEGLSRWRALVALLQEAGISLAREGLSVGLRVGRLPGLGWKKPVLHAHVEPLSLLS